MTKTELVVAKPKKVNCHQIMSLSCGADHSALVDRQGRLFTFGNNKHGQLGLGGYQDEYMPSLVTRIPDHVSQVACGNDHTLVLTTNGIVFSFGSNLHGQLGAHIGVH